MQFQYLSDLHLEFEDNRTWLSANPIVPTGDVLVVAGDTYHLGKDFAKLKFWDFAAANFAHTYVIPGNHEYYGGYDLGHHPLSFREALRDNVFLVNNHAEAYEGVHLIFSTMWSLIDRNEWEVQRGMNDFRLIKYQGQRLNVNDFNEVHKKCWAFLETEIARPGPKVVVTHHLPAEECNIPAFRGSTLNPAFCVDKSRLIATSEITAWIYGHSHRNVADFDIEGTKMRTNQLGYVGYGEHNDFGRDRALKVK